MARIDAQIYAVAVVVSIQDIASKTSHLLAKGADPNGRITTSAMFMGYIGYPKNGAFEPFATGTGDLAGATPLWIAANTANGNTRT